MGKYLLKVEERPGGGGLPTRVGTHVTAQAGSVEVSVVGTPLDLFGQEVVSVSSFLQPEVSSSVSSIENRTGTVEGSSRTAPSCPGGSVFSGEVHPRASGANSLTPCLSVGFVADRVGVAPPSVDLVSTVNGISDISVLASGMPNSLVVSGEHSLLGLSGCLGATGRPASPGVHNVGSLSSLAGSEFVHSIHVSLSTSLVSADVLGSEVLFNKVVSGSSQLQTSFGMEAVASDVPAPLAPRDEVAREGALGGFVTGVGAGGDGDGEGEGGEGESHVEVEVVVVGKLIINNENLIR